MTRTKLAMHILQHATQPTVLWSTSPASLSVVFRVFMYLHVQQTMGVHLSAHTANSFTRTKNHDRAIAISNEKLQKLGRRRRRRVPERRARFGAQLPWCRCAIRGRTGHYTTDGVVSISEARMACTHYTLAYLKQWRRFKFGSESTDFGCAEFGCLLYYKSC